MDIQFGAEQNALIKDFSTYQGENIGSCDLHGDEPIVVQDLKRNKIKNRLIENKNNI